MRRCPKNTKNTSDKETLQQLFDELCHLVKEAKVVGCWHNGQVAIVAIPDADHNSGDYRFECSKGKIKCCYTRHGTNQSATKFPEARRMLLVAIGYLRRRIQAN